MGILSHFCSIFAIKRLSEHSTRALRQPIQCPQSEIRTTCICQPLLIRVLHSLALPRGGRLLLPSA
ncbi:Oxysterol-binding protein 2, partial [Clarias magur]